MRDEVGLNAIFCFLICMQAFIGDNWATMGKTQKSISFISVFVLECT